MDLDNIELIRSITKTALNKYHGDRFDDTIDKLNLIKHDFAMSNIPCYYHISSATTSDGKYAAFNDGQMYIVISFKNTNTININTNLLYSKWFFNKYGRQFNHSSDNVSDYDMEFNLKTSYNTNLQDVLQDVIKEVRHSKLNILV